MVALSGTITCLRCNGVATLSPENIQNPNWICPHCETINQTPVRAQIPPSFEPLGVERGSQSDSVSFPTRGRAWVYLLVTAGVALLAGVISRSAVVAIAAPILVFASFIAWEISDSKLHKAFARFFAEEIEDHVFPHGLDALLQTIVRASAGARGCSVNLAGPHTLVVASTWTPGWAGVIAVILFPIGLLALLARNINTLVVTAAWRPEGSLLIFSGVAPCHLMRRIAAHPVDER